MTVDEQLLQADRQARIDALDVRRSFIVQAPAGSGKTELLIQRYLKLLSVVDNPEEVVAITFTRKATAEMQVRVLDALRRSQKGKVPDAEHEKLTHGLATGVLERSETLGWNLVGNPRRMRVLTLDSLNASIARSRPLSSPGTGARIVQDAELQDCYRAAAMATLDWLTESSPLQQATTEVLRHVDNNTWLYASYLSQMLGTRDQWLPFVGSGLLSDEEAVALREKFEESIRFAVTNTLENTAAALQTAFEAAHFSLIGYAADNLLKDSSESGIGLLADLNELPQALPGKIAEWQGLAELLLTQSGQFRKTVNKNHGFPPGNKEQKDAMLALLESLSGQEELAEKLFRVVALPPVRYSDEQWSVLLALFRLLPIAVAELRRLFGEQGIGDHVEVALAADALLGSAESPGDVALLLDYQVRHLLVDEMQDTSLAQYGMLETLTAGWEAGDGRSLFCVGDPMQSIYRFRNAEVGQFLLARQHGIGQIPLEPLLLRRNFRSGEHLVHWFNTVFTGLLAAEDDPLRGAVAYADAVPVESLAGEGECHTHAVFGADVEEEALAGCRVIAATLGKHPDDDMTVLVRGRTQLPQLLRELRKAGIPYRAVDIDRLTDLPEIIEVLALTRAAAHEGDRIAWLAILRSPWIGLQWADLHGLVRNDSHSTVWELLHDEDRLRQLSAAAQATIRQVRPVLAGLTRARRTQTLRDVVERTWFALGGPAMLSDDYATDNVYRYLDLLGSIERTGSLLDVGELESILDKERVSSDDKARLQVMTMHRAKGLQFDHVLLYGLGRMPGRGDRSVMSWFDLPEQHGIDRKIISPVGPRAELERDPLHRYIEDLEREKERHEQARLLYVACTRAKKSLHLLGHTLVAPDGTSMKPARSDSLLHLLWPALEAEFSRQFDERQEPPGESEASAWPSPPLRRFSDGWRLPDSESLPGSDPAPAVPGEDSPVEYYWVGSDARIAGTLVHRWLQRLAENRSAGRIAATLALDTLSTKWLAEEGIEAHAAPAILDRVRSAVTATLEDEKGRWILEGPGHSELALTGVTEGEVIRVVLDRVRIDDDGTHWIIDYKTSTHEGGNLQGFLDAESARYQAQLARYAQIYSAWSGKEARCALYFPLLRAFVEVPA